MTKMMQKFKYFETNVQTLSKILIPFLSFQHKSLDSSSCSQHLHSIKVLKWEYYNNDNSSWAPEWTHKEQNYILLWVIWFNNVRCSWLKVFLMNKQKSKNCECFLSGFTEKRKKFEILMTLKWAWQKKF